MAGLPLGGTALHCSATFTTTGALPGLLCHHGDQVSSCLKCVWNGREILLTGEFTGTRLNGPLYGSRVNGAAFNGVRAGCPGPEHVPPLSLTVDLPMGDHTLSVFLCLLHSIGEWEQCRADIDTGERQCQGSLVTSPSQCRQLPI